MMKATSPSKRSGTPEEWATAAGMNGTIHVGHAPTDVGEVFWCYTPTSEAFDCFTVHAVVIVGNGGTVWKRQEYLWLLGKTQPYDWDDIDQKMMDELRARGMEDRMTIAQSNESRER